MNSYTKLLPTVAISTALFCASYYIFAGYKPNKIAEVRGVTSERDNKDYLNTLPLPAGSTEVGENIREKFSQITVSSSKPVEDVQRFYKTMLTEKGWRNRDAGDGDLSIVYTRDRERLEVSVLSEPDAANETVFSVSYRE